MIEASLQAVPFVRGRRREDLDTDSQLQLALVRAMEIVGEASSKVSEETKTAHPSVPWKEAVGMRNRLIHAYYDVDLDVVRTTVTRALPELIQKLEKVVSG